MDDVWAERDTKPDHVEAALRTMLAASYHEGRAFVPARVLNLVVIVDADFRGEVENRLRRIGRYHPSRTIVVAVEPQRRTLDAVAAIGVDEAPQSGTLAVGREKIELTAGERHLAKLDVIVDPLLVSDLATVVWAPHGHRTGVDALRRLAQIVLLDSGDEPDVAAALARSAELAERAYVVDLAWLRSTPWRERVAAAFDPPPVRAALRSISEVTVRHREDSLSASLLFCGWLSARLGWKAGSLTEGRDGWTGHASGRRQEVKLRLRYEDMNAPGLAAVTIETAAGESVTLERGRGGLRAHRVARDGSERTYTVLGASRGESGILGEGVRQALLRDPTYAPALEAARVMVTS